MLEHAATVDGSFEATYAVTTAPTLLMARCMTRPLKPGKSTCVNVGVAARALVERMMTPPVAAPEVDTSRLFGLPGSETMSKIDVLPVPGLSRLPSVLTMIFWKVTVPAAAVALVERKTPRRASGGMVLERAFPAAPATPAAVETKMFAGSVGLTRILEIVRPLKQLYVSAVVVPVVICGLIGPTRLAVLSAL